jgi:membrane protein implicated in regulation of membrane protease activity
MPDQTERPPSNAATIVMASILVGAVMVAFVGTFLPGWIGLTGGPAIAMQLVFYAIAAIDVAVAFWLRARLRKTQSSRSGGTVQRE